jgi:hypothetical protein
MGGLILNNSGADMKEQQFLTGSTYNPAFAAKKDAVKPWVSS